MKKLKLVVLNQIVYSDIKNDYKNVWMYEFEPFSWTVHQKVSVNFGILVFYNDSL